MILLQRCMLVTWFLRIWLLSLQILHDFGQPVWKLSWSVTGGILAVSDSKATVTLWKEAIDGQWQQISEDAAAAHQAA